MLKLDRNNMQYFCRTCLGCLQSATGAVTASSVNYNIVETPNLAKLLILCTTLNINEDTDEAYPQQVCLKCYLSLQEIQRFRDMALQSNEVLRGIVENVDGFEVTTSQNHPGTEQITKAEVENSTDQYFANDHFEASQPEISNSYFVVQEKEMEFDEFLDNNKEIKIETAMFDIDTYVNPADSAAKKGMECSSEAVDYASTSKAAAKRKCNADDDTNTFICPLVDCTMEFTTIKALQKHNNDVHGAAMEANTNIKQVNTRLAMESYFERPLKIPVVVPSSSGADTLQKRKSCQLCTLGDEKIRRLTRFFCSKCSNPVCLQHSKSEYTCFSCLPEAV